MTSLKYKNSGTEKPQLFFSKTVKPSELPCPHSCLLRKETSQVPDFGHLHECTRDLTRQFISITVAKV